MGLPPAAAVLYAVLGERRRRGLVLRLWNAGLAVREGDACLADVWERFVATLLYARLQITARPEFDALALFGARNTDFMLQRAWLTPQEWDALAAYKGPPTVLEGVWRRTLVRDFLLLVREELTPYRYVSLLVALQRLVTRHAEGGADTFLSAAHRAWRGGSVLRELPCWHTSRWDPHYAERRAKAPGE